MKRHLKLFLLYFAQYAKVRLAYKADFFIAFFSSMTATVLGFGFVLVLFSKIPELEGWSFYEILFLYAFSLVPLGFFNVVSWNLYEFGDIYVIQGRFDRSSRFSSKSSGLNPFRKWRRACWSSRSACAACASPGEARTISGSR